MKTEKGGADFSAPPLRRCNVTFPFGRVLALGSRACGFLWESALVALRAGPPTNWWKSAAPALAWKREREREPSAPSPKGKQAALGGSCAGISATLGGERWLAPWLSYAAYHKPDGPRFFLPTASVAPVMRADDRGSRLFSGRYLR